MSEAHIDAVARRLITAWRTGQRQPLAELSLPDAAAAYAVQRQVSEALGWFAGTRPTAWKLGGAPGGLISAAAVPAAAIHRSDWRVPPAYVTALGIEGELVIRLGRDLSGTSDLAEIRAAIDAWMPAIELCDTRLEDGASADPLLRLADQQLNRALILGEPVQLTEPLNGHVKRRCCGSMARNCSGPPARILSSTPCLPCRGWRDTPQHKARPCALAT